MVELLTKETYEEILRTTTNREGEVDSTDSVWQEKINQILEAAEEKTKKERREFLDKLPGHNGVLLRAIDKRNEENRKINKDAPDLLDAEFRFTQKASDEALNQYRNRKPVVIENVAVKVEAHIATERAELSGIFISSVGDLLNLEKRDIISEVLKSEKTFSEIRAELASRGTIEFKKAEETVIPTAIVKEKGGFFAAVKRGWNSLFRKNSPVLA